MRAVTGYIYMSAIWLFGEMKAVRGFGVNSAERMFSKLCAGCGFQVTRSYLSAKLTLGGWAGAAALGAGVVAAR